MEQKEKNEIVDDFSIIESNESWSVKKKRKTKKPQEKSKKKILLLDQQETNKTTSNFPLHEYVTPPSPSRYDDNINISSDDQTNSSTINVPYVTTTDKPVIPFHEQSFVDAVYGFPMGTAPYTLRPQTFPYQENSYTRPELPFLIEREIGAAPNQKQWEGILKCSAAPVGKTRAKWWWLLQAERTKLNIPCAPKPRSEMTVSPNTKLPPRSKLKELLQWAQNIGSNDARINFKQL